MASTSSRALSAAILHVTGRDWPDAEVQEVVEDLYDSGWFIGPTTEGELEDSYVYGNDDDEAEEEVDE